MAGTNFGGSSNPPNRSLTGEANFGGLGKIKFGGFLVKEIFNGIHFSGYPNETV